MNNPSGPQGYYPPPLPTSTLAIVSLIAGLTGLTIFPFLGSIVAIISGMMARGETRAMPPRASGDGLATAGLVLGWIGVGLGVCGLCVALTFFVLLPLLGLGGLYLFGDSSSSLILPLGLAALAG